MAESANKQTAFERTKELTDRLEAGITDLFQSDKYKEYLKSMSQFYRYSTRNTLLIHMQNPHATRVASFKLWDEKFNRHVKKGETGIRIFAPIMTKEKREFDKIDPVTKSPLLDENGNIVTEELESETLRFKLVPVFDISQTYGDPLPELVENLIGDVVQYEAFLDALRETSPLPIMFEPLRDGNDGYCRYGDKIGIREGMSEVQTISAVVHEITHAKLHDKEKAPETAVNKSNSMKEVEAESISYVVCQHYGIETSPNSFGYLAEWGSRDMSEFKASLDTIRKEASVLITDIDERFGAICKERGIDLTAKAPEPAAPEPPAVTEPVTEQSAEPSFRTEERTENIAGVAFTATDIIPEPPEETYDIAYWQLGTGVDVLHYFNEGSERYGDYETLAHISPDRSVEFVIADLPDDIKDKINDYAMTAEIPNMAAEKKEPAEIMPDTTITVLERNSFGYTADELLPLHKDKALELFDTDHTIYMLYDDNTEEMVFDREEIITFAEMDGGIFGIEREDWQRTEEYAKLQSQNGETVKEYGTIEPNTDIDEKSLPDLPEAEPIEKSVYRESIPYARDNDELDKYRADVKLNTECRNAIDTAINESRYDTHFYKMKDAVKQVIDTYGAERVELLMAKIVQGADWDGWYSHQNKEWAKTFEIPQSMKDIYSNTHPCLLDGFLSKVREKPSLLETLKANTEKSRQQSDPKQDTKKPKEMEM